MLLRQLPQEGRLGLVLGQQLAYLLHRRHKGGIKPVLPVTAQRAHRP